MTAASRPSPAVASTMSTGGAPPVTPRPGRSPHACSTKGAGGRDCGFDGRDFRPPGDRDCTACAKSHATGRPSTACVSASSTHARSGRPVRHEDTRSCNLGASPRCRRRCFSCPFTCEAPSPACAPGPLSSRGRVNVVAMAAAQLASCGHPACAGATDTGTWARASGAVVHQRRAAASTRCLQRRDGKRAMLRCSPSHGRAGCVSHVTAILC